MGAVWLVGAMWMEFAEAGMDWRPLRLPFGGDSGTHDWTQEEVTFFDRIGVRMEGEERRVDYGGVESGGALD